MMDHLVGRFGQNLFALTIPRLPDRAPGSDGLSNQIWKNLPEALLAKLWAYFELCIRKRDIHPAFVELTTVLLYKGKGNPLWLENWRPIALAKTIYKIFSSLITDALSEYLKRHHILSWEQEGFQALKRAQRLTSALWIKLDLLQGLQRPFIGVHTDFYGAYPSMEHKILRLVLEWLGLPLDFITLVFNVYAHAVTTVLTAVGTTRPVAWLRGTLQGDPLSCLLFLCYVEPLLRWLKASIPPSRLIWEAEPAAAYMFVDDLQSAYESPSAEVVVGLSLIHI